MIPQHLVSHTAFLMVFFVFSESRRVVIFPFVDIGEIVYLRCLNFLFITMCLLFFRNL